MKKIQTFIYVLLMGFAFAACQDDSLGGTEQGGIRIALTDGTAGVDVTTRSTPSELFDGFKQKFKFQIKGGDNYDQTHDWTKDVIPLAAGVYDITATCGTEQADGVVKFDAPCYTGTKEGLKVNAGETATTAEISCKVTNALVSIQFDDEYKEYITDATYAMIAVESGTETNWADLSTSAYFKAGSSLTKLKIFKDGTDSQGADILTDAQKDANFPKTFAAGDHLILTLSIAKANGNVAIKVSKVEVKKVTIEETIPLEWLPKPKVEADGFTNNALTFVETETPPAKLNLDLASALQDIKFKFDFQDEQFSSLAKDKEYLLSTDKATIEQALGITLPAIGATNASIDFAPFVAKLQSKVDGATTNKIMIVPKANNRWSSEKTDVDSVYTFTCNKPEFSIAVQEGNVWTKTFTIDEPTVTAGNAETIKSKLKYQYKTENGEWQDCEQLVQFDSAPTEKSYQVRAIYRDAIASEEVAVTLETPAQLPNSGFEDWYEEDQDDHKNLWFPYAQGASGAQWTTNNSETTNYRSESFCSTSGVKKTTSIIYSGTAAAWIRTVGHGIWNTNVGGLGSLNGSITGTGTIGILSYSDVFAVRPTKISFNYRYIQKGDDAGVVELKIENQEQNVVLFETSFTVTNTDYIKRDIPIEYSITNIPATHLTLTFKSGSKHTEVVKAKVRGDNVDGTEANEHYGSELYIDDIQLIYDK